MYKIEFYEDKNGKSNVVNFIKDLNKKATTSKDGEIWELRPLRNRFLYAYYKDNKFIILHHFVKKTQKTPKREIDQAKRNLQDYIERNESYDHMGRTEK